MTGFCAAGDHAGCPDAHSDAGTCSCPCHLVGDAVDAAMPITMLGLLRLCGAFSECVFDAQGWMHLYPNEETWESPDCDVMSKAFLEHAQEQGHDGRLVHLQADDDVALVSDHYIAVIDGWAIDWTARQFYNAVPYPYLEPTLIPCPFIFPWTGTYPYDWLKMREVPE